MVMVTRFLAWQAGAGALVSVLLATGPAAAAEPIRVGYLGPLTGIFAQAGKDMLQNTIIYTYPMVSQFWTYKPEEFLKTPVYERNYPPVKP